MVWSGRGSRRPRTDLLDLAIFGVEERAAEDGVLRVHEDQSVDVADESREG